MITENLSTLKIHKLTQAQYDRELANGNIDENALYLTPDEEVDLSEYVTTEDVSSTYETKADAVTKLTEAKTYADTAATTAANTIKNELLNGAGTAYDTLKEIGDLIDENTDAIEALEIVASGKADISHSHTDVHYTKTEIDAKLSDKSEVSHNHDDVYDAKGTAEALADEIRGNLNVVNDNLNAHIDNTDIHFTATEREKLTGIDNNANFYVHPDSGVSTGTYKSVTVDAQGHIIAGSNPTTLAEYGIVDADSKGAADEALLSAKEYTDEQISIEVTNRDAAIAVAKNSAVSTAASDATTKANNALSSAKEYADTVSNAVKNDLLNGAGEAYDTLKEIGDLIDENTDAIEALEIVASGKADKVHSHNDIYYTETEIDDKVSTINTSISNSLDEAKSYSDTNLNTAKTYADNAVAQKTQVQIVTSDITEMLPTLKIHKLTQEQYDQEVEDGTLDENALYLTPEETAEDALNNLGAVSIVRGSYIGTGVSGESNPNTLVFERNVAMLIILPARDSENDIVKYHAAGELDDGTALPYADSSPLFLYDVNYAAAIDNTSMNKVSVASFDTTVSWWVSDTYLDSPFSSSIVYQRNEAGKIYNYIAFLYNGQ